MHSQQFLYPRDPERPDELNLPYIPITLSSKHRSLQCQALLDSGAKVNVIPYRVGLELGAPWGQTPAIHLTGNLEKVPTHAIGVMTRIGDFAPHPLLFAWTQSKQAPVILGLVDFFMEFNVCFFASEGVIEIAPR